jgi:hypothetical protein
MAMDWVDKFNGLFLLLSKLPKCFIKNGMPRKLYHQKKFQMDKSVFFTRVEENF